MDEPLEAPLVGAAVARGAGRLARAGCDTPRLDAELLLAFALGVARERLVLDHDAVLDRRAWRRYEELLARREAREPAAYILGRRDFRRLTLGVDRRVLVPRPETELLVEVGLSLPPGAGVADVGTGSGAVALALADERPDLRVRGLDVDPAAVAVARENARRLGLKASFSVADLLDEGEYDAILANLPYVREGDALPPEVLFEPPGALFGGADGLSVIRRLVGRAGTPLLAVEIDPGQAEAVEGLLREGGYERVERLRDLAGRERVVVGRRA